MKPASLVATLFLLLVALLHVLRLVFQAPLVVGSVDIPAWPSAVAAFALAGLALWLWREQRQ